ncbi:MAG: bifunctional phosphoglucose/phosphomannose isomerase [Calditrichia bacterium]
MRDSDHSNFYEFISQLPEQIKASQEIFAQSGIQKLPDTINQVILLGMGGSAIAGDLLSAYLQWELPIPFIVNRNYSLPKYVDSRSLVLACSYSGNTEETLYALQETLERGATIIALTSNGKLKDLALKNQLPLIEIPGGLPPRQALGYMFFPLLYLLQHAGFIDPRDNEIKETIDVLNTLRENNEPRNTHRNNFCSHIARQLYGKIPIIYTASEMLQPVVTRWRNQLNENSKILAFSNVFPELNHNEIMGWEAPPNLLEPFSILLLRDKDEYLRNTRRLEISRDLWRKKNIPIFEIFGEGTSRLARLFSQIYFGDWISYYMALLYEKDPIKIQSIDYLKKALEKI